MRKIFPLIMMLLLFSAKAAAQFSLQNFHLNLFGGMANYHGDLQNKWFTFSQSKLAGGIGGTYDLSDHLSLRGTLVYAHISADDKLGNHRARNLNFTSRLYEASAGVEYYLTPLDEHVLTPYVFGGIALYHFNPYTFDSTGKMIGLQILNTEGEGFVAGRPAYKIFQYGIPFGAGVKFSLSENINVGIEIGFRKLFTDYLDDVSTTYVDENTLLAKMGPRAVEFAYRGDELKNGMPYPPGGTQRGTKPKDWYYLAGFTASFRIFRKEHARNDTHGFRHRHAQYDCPGNVR
jgi:opacity protein-like surface antigen